MLLSGYRSPETNAMLRATSSGVARNSLHMRGQAADSGSPAGRSVRSPPLQLRVRRGRGPLLRVQLHPYGLRRRAHLGRLTARPRTASFPTRAPRWRALSFQMTPIRCSATPAAPRPDHLQHAQLQPKGRDQRRQAQQRRHPINRSRHGSSIRPTSTVCARRHGCRTRSTSSGSPHHRRRHCRQRPGQRLVLPQPLHPRARGRSTRNTAQTSPRSPAPARNPPQSRSRDTPP